MSAPTPERCRAINSEAVCIYAAGHKGPHFFNPSRVEEPAGREPLVGDETEALRAALRAEQSLRAMLASAANARDEALARVAELEA